MSLPALYSWKQLLTDIPAQVLRILCQYVVDGILAEASLSEGSLDMGALHKLCLDSGSLAGTGTI